MKGVDVDGPAGPEVHVFPGGSPFRDHETDVVETVPRRRRPWWRRPEVGPVVAALVVGVLVGYLIGVRTAGAPAPVSDPAGGVRASHGDSVLVTPAAQPLAATGNRCSSQNGDKLMLGVEIVNQSTTTVTVLRVAPHFPLGGLRMVTTEWRRCGQVSPVDNDATPSLAPGSTSWFLMTFDVLIPCPAPIPVQFTLTYAQANLTGVADLRGFPDLGGVPYTGCTASPG